MRTTILLACLLVVLASAGPALAAKPTVTSDNDKIVLQNDFVHVWFQGKKPMLKVMAANGTGGYGYTFTRLVEYRDLDASGAPSDNEIVASLDLARSDGWNVTTNTTDSSAELALALEAPVKLGKGDIIPAQAPVSLPNGTLPRNDTASIALDFHIRDAAAKVALEGVNVTIPATSIKYDLIVKQWPFVNADLDRLALVSTITGNLTLANATGVDGAEVATNGTSAGALTWSTIARGNTTAGQSVDVPVKVATDNASAGESTLTFTYDAPGLATLVHDPTIGTVATPSSLQESAGALGSAAHSVPGFSTLAVMGAGAAAAAVLTARRRR